jgi:hypothetical protein
MSEPKKRQPGRPSLPVEEKRSRNLTFRSRGDLRDRLNDAASQAGRSISEEIESRLEQSFETEDRVALVREIADKNLKDMDQRVEAFRAEREKFWSEKEKVYREMDVELQSAKALLDVQTERISHLQRIQDRLQGAEDTLTALLGKNEQKSELVRHVVLELGKIPDDQLVSEDTARRLERVIADNISVHAVALAAEKWAQK